MFAQDLVRRARRAIPLRARSNRWLVPRLGRRPSGDGSEPYIRRHRPKYGALWYPPAVTALSVEPPADEWVIGIARDGEARAYPVSALKWHHIANDRVGGDPVTVTFCIKCFSGIAFDPMLDGVLHTFDVAGMHEGAVAMRDEETGTVWCQLTGEGLVGPLKGRRLEIEPSHFARWSDWLRLHPDTLTPHPSVLADEGSWGPGDFRLSESVRTTVSRWDRRLEPTSLVVGIAVDGEAYAYPLDAGRPRPRLAQFELGEVPIALLAPPGAWPLAYDRRVGGSIVDLRLEQDRIVGQDGTAWTGRGSATEGPLAGAALRFVPSRVCRWYGWAAIHPTAEIIGRGEPSGAG